MHYLGLALYAEGRTDYAFLCPLLLRLCEDVCRGARQAVDIGGVLPLDDPPGMARAPRDERIARAADEARPAWNILFVHADADADAHAALRERVWPSAERIRQRAYARAEIVAVIPVRETEAWTLADGDAIRRVLGTSLGNEALGLRSRGASLERLGDPKEQWNAILAAARRSRRSPRRDLAGLLPPLGERCDLDCLRELPSFQHLEADLRSALAHLQIL